MLKLLLDEHISPQVAKGLRRAGRPVVVYALAEWEGGNFLGQEDEACLREAADQGLTLVTYDRRTIPPLLKAWAEAGLERGGVIFVDEKTISPADFGGLVRALRELARETEDWDWAGRVCFLRR
jgi:PIN like domain